MWSGHRATTWHSDIQSVNNVLTPQQHFRAPVSAQVSTFLLSGGLARSENHTHTHTHRGLNNEQGVALFPVRSGDKRSNDSVRLDVALGSGPLWDRWDTLEGHVFPSPHRLVKSSPLLTLHRLRPSLREREKKGERERERLEWEREKVCVKKRERERIS